MAHKGGPIELTLIHRKKNIVQDLVVPQLDWCFNEEADAMEGDKLSGALCENGLTVVHNA